MTAIAEVDYDTVFGGGGDEDPTDAVCILSSSSTLPELNSDGFAVLLVVAILFRIRVLPGSGSKQCGEHRVDILHARGATGLV